MYPGENSISIVWKSFQSGDKDAFKYFYNLYVNDLYRYGTKLSKDESLVQDAIQEVFIDFYLKRSKPRMNPDNLKYYLILALKRNIIKKLKRNRKLSDEKPDNDAYFEPDYSIEKSIIEKEEDEEQIKKVKFALSQLPSKQKEAIYLRFNQSLEYPEIAEILDISVESVRKQVYRALKSVRESCRKQSVIL